MISGDLTWYWAQLRQLHTAPDDASLAAAIRTFAAARGFDNFGFAAYHGAACRTEPTARLTALLDFPSQWQKRYDTLGGRQGSSDPVMRHVRAGLSPTAWSCRGQVTDTDPTIRRSARHLLGYAGECGLRAGITMPVYGPGVEWAYLVLTTRRTDQTSDVMPEMIFGQLFAQAILVVARRLAGVRESVRELTERERETLLWAAAGKTSWEISVILGISECTVNFRLQAAAAKLGVRGRAAAVARAVALSLIVP